MAATVQIDEYNTAGQTLSSGVANMNYGSTDAPALDPVAYPITANTYSYEKWNKFNVTNMGGSSAVKNINLYYTGTLSGSDTFKTSAVTSGYSAPTWATPVNTSSSKATTTMPTSAAGTNVGIGGSLTGSITVAGQADYVVTQIKVDTATTSGASLTINWRYDEVA